MGINSIAGAGVIGNWIFRLLSAVVALRKHCTCMYSSYIILCRSSTTTVVVYYRNHVYITIIVCELKYTFFSVQSIDGRQPKTRANCPSPHPPKKKKYNNYNYKKIHICIRLLNFILFMFLGTLLLTENLFNLYLFDPSQIYNDFGYLLYACT